MWRGTRRSSRFRTRITRAWRARRAIAALIRTEIERINPQLVRAEQVKDFRIIDTLLTAEDEELTPTMKLKRKVIARKYAPLIDSMYGKATPASDPVPAPA